MALNQSEQARLAKIQEDLSQANLWLGVLIKAVDEALDSRGDSSLTKAKSKAGDLSGLVEQHITHLETLKKYMTPLQKEIKVFRDDQKLRQGYDNLDAIGVAYKKLFDNGNHLLGQAKGFLDSLICARLPAL
jgi:hypothetical protein